MLIDDSSIDYSYGEWAMTLGGYHIGYAPNYSEAATIINQTAWEWTMLALEVGATCPNCGDVVFGICQACREWQPHAPIDVDYTPIGFSD